MENVKRLCMNADIVASQETWLLQHDLQLLGDVDDNFEYTAKTAVDLSSGVLRGRPHGGVALLWRKSVFPRVTVVKCNSERIAAIRMEDEDGRVMIVMSVYMPTDHMDNLPLFCQCLGEMTAIIQDNNIEVVYMLGDYNAHPNAPFGIELLEFCDENDWICADLELADAYKSVEQFREQYKKVGNESFSPSDTLVGRAMDFVYSNQTFMNLIARELWNVGSRAIDKIVEIGGQGGNKMEHNTKYTK